MSLLRTILLVLALALPVSAAAEEAAPGKSVPSSTPEELYNALKNAGSSHEAREIELRIYAWWTHTKSPSALLLLEQASALVAEGRLAPAGEKLDVLIEIAPGYVEGWSVRALVNRERGKIPDALTDLQHVLALEDRHFRALSLLGSIFEELEDYEAALKAWEAALEINPHLEGGPEAVRRLTDKVRGRGI